MLGQGFEPLAFSPHRGNWLHAFHPDREHSWYQLSIMSATTIVWMLYALEEQEAMLERAEKEQATATIAAATTTPANTSEIAGDATKGANLFKVSKVNPLRCRELAGRMLVNKLW